MCGQGEFGKVTPQTAEFMKYGDVPISLYTGKTNYEIPIYHIKDKDFDIPISIIYTSDGFKPSKRSNIVGYNWFLSVGGVVTREVYGSPDDASTDRMEGLWWATQQRTYDKSRLVDVKKMISENLISLQYSYYDFPMINSRFYDAMPDLFNFNFLGHKGQFMIGTDRKVITNVDGYKINLSNLGKQIHGAGTLLKSEIEIMTPDGYRYYFGGNSDALEYSKAFKPGINDNTAISLPPPTILGWYITKIIAPNGRIIQFNYVNGDENKFDPIWQSHKTHRLPNGGQLTDPADKYNYTAIKGVVLASIEIKDVMTKIEFVNNKEKDIQSFFDNYYLEYNGPVYQLDTVKVKCENSTFYTYSFNYVNKEKRRFLNAFTSTDGGVYKFEYNHPGGGYPTPDPERSGKTDHWGYWINNNAQDSYGLLKRIVYPTTGYTDFLYERHTYSNRIETIFHDKDTKLYTKIVPKNETVGGTRIKKIINYSSNGKVENQKEYFYTMEYATPSVGKSSGILHSYPPYKLTNLGQVVYIGENVSLENYNIEEPHIGYSNILESFNDGSCISYKFSDYFSNPDLANANIYILDPSTINYEALVQTNVSRMNSESTKRGLLQKKILYNSDKLSIREEVYKFDNVNDLERNPIIPPEGGDIPIVDQNYLSSYNYVTSFRPFIGGGLSKKIYLKSHPLVYKSVKVDKVLTEYRYTYNGYKMMSRESVIIGNKDSVIHTYKYSGDSFSPAINIQKDLTDRNILSLLIEKKTYKNNVCLNTTFNTYRLHNNTFPVLDSIKSSIGNNPLEIRTVFPQYDNYGNLIYFIQDDVLKTVYLWSYNGQYPIAEIKNASYNQVKDALGISPEYVSETFIPDMTLINSLKNSLQESMVSTNTYIPLVGMTSTSNPNNMTTYYEYDKSGRLKTIKDLDKSMISTHQYRYNNQVSWLDTASISAPSLPLFDSLSISLEMKGYDDIANNECVYYMENTPKVVKLNAIPVGGSNSFSYNWSVFDPDNKEIFTERTFSKENSFTFQRYGKMKIILTIVDLKSGSISKVTKSFSIEKPPLEFKNIQKQTYSDWNQYSATADIYCSELTTITFNLDINMQKGNASVDYQIGNKNYSFSSTGKNEVTISLPMGITNVSINVYANGSSHSITSLIRMRSAVNRKIGKNSSILLPALKL